MNKPTYWDYLRLDRLLTLQGGLEDDEEGLLSDELHFIVVHQVYELWFKLVLRSVRLARDRLSVPRVPEQTVPFVVHHLRRVTEILKLAVSQFQVMETLTPQDFLAFREKLIPASGFQSFQMRELEILLGLQDAERIRYGKVDPVKHIDELGQGSPAGELARERLRRAREETTVLEALSAWLYRTPIQGSTPEDEGDDAVVSTFLEEYVEAAVRGRMASLERLVEALGETSRSELVDRFEHLEVEARRFLFAEDLPEEERAYRRRVRAALLFIESYRELPLLAWPRLLLDAVVEMEEQLVLWRNRHARMVERLIGRRVGTGGSHGVDYLDRTTAYRVFGDLWAIRTVLLPKDALPPLTHASAYGFATH